jgi:hypothetical protein
MFGFFPNPSAKRNFASGDCMPNHRRDTLQTLDEYNRYNDPVARRRENLLQKLTDQKGPVLAPSYQRVTNLKEDLPGVVDRLVILTNEGGFDAQLKAFAEAAAASLASFDFLAGQLRDSPPKRWGAIPRVFFS